MMPLKERPRCGTLQDVQSRSGQCVILIGTYHQVDMRMRRKSPPLYAGHVAIRLRDGTDVLLEPSWSTAGIRNLEEQARFGGKVVEVTGVVHSLTPKPAETVAYAIGPCVSPVEDICLAAEE